MKFALLALVLAAMAPQAFAQKTKGGWSPKGDWLLVSAERGREGSFDAAILADVASIGDVPVKSGAAPLRQVRVQMLGRTNAAKQPPIIVTLEYIDCAARTHRTRDMFSYDHNGRKGTDITKLQGPMKPIAAPHERTLYSLVCEGKEAGLRRLPPDTRPWDFIDRVEAELAEHAEAVQ
jgi:hypothetical protein